MIHFNFVVTDDEAEAIFDSIEDSINNSRYELPFGIPANREWHRGRIAYLEELKAKMTNEKIS